MGMMVGEGVLGGDGEPVDGVGVPVLSGDTETLVEAFGELPALAVGAFAEELVRMAPPNVAAAVRQAAKITAPAVIRAPLSELPLFRCLGPEGTSNLASTCRPKGLVSYCITRFRGEQPSAALKDTCAIGCADARVAIGGYDTAVVLLLISASGLQSRTANRHPFRGTRQLLGAYQINSAFATRAAMFRCRSHLADKKDIPARRQVVRLLPRRSKRAVLPRWGHGNQPLGLARPRTNRLKR
jgi:hypothetical protein